MKKLTHKYEIEAINYCKKLANNSIEYKESILYTRFGAKIGLKKCSEIATKY